MQCPFISPRQQEKNLSLWDICCWKTFPRVPDWQRHEHVRRGEMPEGFLLVTKAAQRAEGSITSLHNALTGIDGSGERSRCRFTPG